VTRVECKTSLTTGNRSRFFVVSYVNEYSCASRDHVMSTSDVTVYVYKVNENNFLGLTIAVSDDDDISVSGSNNGSCKRC